MSDNHSHDQDDRDTNNSDATDPVVNSPPRIRSTQTRQKQSAPEGSTRPRQRQSRQRQQTTAAPARPESRRRQQAQPSQQPRRRGLWKRLRRGRNDSDEKKAIELARRLEYASSTLLEKLFAYLSQLPEIIESNDGNGNGGDPLSTTNTSMPQQGVTLPAAAVAWLSSQLYPEPWEEEEEEEEQQQQAVSPSKHPAVSLDADEVCSLVTSVPEHRTRQRRSRSNQDHYNNNDNMGLWLGGVALQDRLSLLRFLLPRVQMIRITRQAWPPPLPHEWKSESLAHSSSRQHTTNPTTPPRRQRPPTDLNCSTISSVNSALTMEEGVWTSTGTATANTISPRQAFLDYMHRLEHAPSVDLRIFPNTKVLILESVPPSWVQNVHQLNCGLQVLRIERAAVYHLPLFLFSKRQRQQLSAKTSGNSTRTQPPPPNLYPHLTHVRLDHCSLGELSGLSACLSKLPHIQYLSLQHNEIHQERTALKGLQHMPRLSVLDLRYNCLQRMPRANLYLGGQLHTLKLSYNQLTTTRGGLDKCYALRELWLDGNCIQDLYQVSGLARLPELQLLRLHNNPVTTLGNSHFDPGWKVQLWTWFQEERRAITPLELPMLVDIAGTSNGGVIALGTGVPTERDWSQIQEGSFSIVVGPPATSDVSLTEARTTPNLITLGQATSLQLQDGVTPASIATETSFFSMQTPSAQSVSTYSFASPTRSVRVTKKSKTRRAVIGNGTGSATKPADKKRRGLARTKKSSLTTKQLVSKSGKTEPSNGRRVAFSVQDVLVSLQDPIPPAVEGDGHEEPSPVESEKHVVSIKLDSPSTDAPDTSEKPPQVDNPLNPFADDGIEDELVANEKDEKVPKGGNNHAMQENVAEPKLMDGSPKSTDEKEKDTAIEGNDEKSEVLHESHDEVPAEDSPQDPPEPFLTKPIEDEDRIFPSVRPKMATIKLQKQIPSNTLNVLDYDWDELIKRASEGKIPDGLAKSPVVTLEHSASAVTLEARNGAAKVFSEEAAELLPVNTAESASQQQPSVIQSSASLSASNPADTVSDRLPNTLPEHIWKDDDSVLSSLGASREDLAPIGASKFQIAEENSFYDGPDSSREMKVVENLRLYFEVYVFPDSVPTVPQSVLQELEQDHDDWQSITLYFPRIQLWPDDRRRLERALLSSSVHDPDWAENREKFLRLWEEELIPCGKPALRRLQPNRRIRLGFHGDQLFEGPDLDAYSECRKILLCLSSKAFYVILREDTVTANHKEQAKQRRFPLPIDNDLFFRDAPWPHSVARHSLLDLEAICIGFEFQRLTLRFRNPVLPKSDPFVYVVLSSNKKSTVKILQELQKAAKDLKENSGTLASEKTPVAIENDSNSVFDALSAAVAPELLGTVEHYQILQQYWRRGDRGTVRRTCVVTETKILLLDEDFTADGHNLSDITVHRDKMADVRYRKVDEATLKQVTEVQAAGTDPRAITIIISGVSTLSRTHRWRLLCRDREGAERLVDDVRKALANSGEVENL